jgi:hypothetical protein
MLEVKEELGIPWISEVVNWNVLFYDNPICVQVITFKNPYLGNTCVPFQHVACSNTCARAIEIPARHEQQLSARRQDREYEQ